ncbi:MAG: DUF1906 domain-containing protein [Methylobacteriaceae bacterium]|nr:DUF1906 domain-containing protein [Methylobacteriaceae bacterium]
MPDKFLGFDVMSYPGDGTVAWLWAHGFRICGLYLNHHRGGKDESWISHRPRLANSGWGLAPLYLGWQTVDNHGHQLPPPGDPQTTAAADAREAVALMQAAGFGVGSTIFFDIEDGTIPSGSYDRYLVSWFGAVRAANYVPATYCSYRLASWARQNNIPCWSFHIPANGHGPFDPGSLPAASIDDGCIGTQFRQEAHLNGLPLAVDLDWFSIRDPSSAHAVSQPAD